MSGKDSSIVSKEALMGTKPGKQIIKQGLFKSKGYRMFSKYKLEAEIELPKLAERLSAGELSFFIAACICFANLSASFGSSISASSLYLENMRYPLDLKSPCLIICLPGLVPMRASLLTIEESLPLICKQGMFCY